MPKHIGQFDPFEGNLSGSEMTVVLTDRGTGVPHYEKAAASLFGASGTPGASGASGLQGPAGASGAQGAPGASGAQGPTGASGAQGPTGASGAGGPPGASGAIGASGASGLQGTTGASGASGLQGQTGASGASGLQGTAGAKWFGAGGSPLSGSGVDGDWAIDTTAHAYYGPKFGGLWTGTGPNSLMGPSGASGAQGPAGASGASGTGASGASGLQGPAGASGASGLQGASGASGAAGTTRLLARMFVAARTYTNLAAASAESSATDRMMADLTGLNSVRLFGHVSTVGASIGKLQGQYSTDGTVFSNLSDVMPLQTPAGLKTSASAAIPAPAMTVVLLRVIGACGDGVADPVVNAATLEFK